MSVGSLSREEFEVLWDVLTSGVSPTNLRHVKYLFAGRTEAMRVINDVLVRFSSSNIPLQILIIGGERGVGKTFTAFYLMSCIRENPQYQILPVYISFDKISSSMDFVSKLFYDIVFGLMQYVEEERYRDRIRSLMESFGVNITYAKLRPEEAEAPIGLLSELCEIAEDHGVKLCIILDELDLIADESTASKIYACFERLLGFQNSTRIPKLYVLCATSRALEEIKNLRGRGFISRIWSALENATQVYLKDLDNDEKEQIVSKILDIYKECYNINVQSVFPLLIDIIKNVIGELRLPREIITATIEILKAYDSVKSQLSQTYMQMSSISKGIAMDRVLRDRLLSQIGQIFPQIEFRKLENVTFPSVLSPNKARSIDGEFVFPDGFRLGIEIKFSETKATLGNDALDQLMSYLIARSKENVEAEAAFILLGSYTHPPFTDNQLEILKSYGLAEKVHVFSHPSGTLITKNIEQLILSAKMAEGIYLHNILRLMLAAFGMLTFLRKLLAKHKGEVREGEAERVPSPPPLKPPEKIKLRAFLEKVKIKGLGPKTLEKLEKAGFEYVEDFIKTDANQIFQQLRNIGYSKAPKPYKIKEWQNAIQEALSAQLKIT